MSADDQTRQCDSTRLAGTAVLVASLAAWVLAGAAAPQEKPADPFNEAREKGIEFYGGGTMEIVARKLNVEEIMGKLVETRASSPKRLEAAAIASSSASLSAAVSDKPNNTAIRYFPNVSENEPTVAANPRDPNKVVAGTHFIGDTGNRCVAHYSRNGGKTWNPIPIFMPQKTHDSQCSDPVLAYAPDGSRVYYAYMDIKFATTFEIVVSYSDDDGKTWRGPYTVLTNVLADYDKPWIGTHVPVGGGDNDASQANKRWVYVSATRFDFGSPFACHIDFTRSSDKANSWSAPQTLDSSDGGCGTGPSPVVVQGSRPQGGLGGGVIVAWYNSGADGPLEGSFQIRTRYSADNGAKFGEIIVASINDYEAPFWLGPFAAYHRWWGVMFPDIEIAQNGSAHILYTYDPVLGSATAEDGDIRYIGSVGPPYTVWDSPLPTTVSDDTSGKAQGWATLEAASRWGDVTLYAIWEDHRTDLTPHDNQYYDVFWTKKMGYWRSNEKLTDKRSTSDLIFLGDYYDITIARRRDHNDGLFVYGVWTDRRDEPTEDDLDDDVWGARIPPVDDYEKDSD